MTIKAQYSGNSLWDQMGEEQAKRLQEFLNANQIDINIKTHDGFDTILRNGLDPTQYSSQDIQGRLATSREETAAGKIPIASYDKTTDYFFRNVDMTDMSDEPSYVKNDYDENRKRAAEAKYNELSEGDKKKYQRSNAFGGTTINYEKVAPELYNNDFTELSDQYGALSNGYTYVRDSDPEKVDRKDMVTSLKNALSSNDPHMKLYVFKRDEEKPRQLSYNNANGQYQLSEPLETLEEKPKKPNLWKRFAHFVFGAYKEEFANYRGKKLAYKNSKGLVSVLSQRHNKQVQLEGQMSDVYKKCVGKVSEALEENLSNYWTNKQNFLKLSDVVMVNGKSIKTLMKEGGLEPKPVVNVANSEGKSEVKGEDKSKVKDEDKSKVKGEDKSKVKGEDKSKVKDEVKGEDKSKVKGEDKSKVKDEVKAEAKAEAKVETKSEDEIVAEIVTDALLNGQEVKYMDPSRMKAPASLKVPNMISEIGENGLQQGRYGWNQKGVDKYDALGALKRASNRQVHNADYRPVANEKASWEKLVQKHQDFEKSRQLANGTVTQKRKSSLTRESMTAEKGREKAKESTGPVVG